MRKSPVSALMLTLILGLSACNFYYNDVPSPDDLMHHVSWFDHMIVSKAAHPYQTAHIPRITPAGAVPITGGERDYRTGVAGAMGSSFDTLVAKKLLRPSGPAKAGARSGGEVFNIYCSVCHGYKAAGDGTVGPFVAAPSLLTAVARSYSDGYLYSMIRYGRGRMPQYGDKIVRQDERWAVVDYVRSLQAASPAPVAPAAPKAGKP